MLDSNSATPWLAFLVGAIVMAVIAAGFFFYGSPRQQTAELQLRPPQIEAPKITPPSITPPDLKPPPITPPSDIPSPVR